MRAAVLYYPREIRLEDRPLPVPGPGEVRVGVNVSGLCGTDIHLYEGLFHRPGQPFPARVLGHDFAGIVEAVGEGVLDLQPGDRVTVEPNRSCGECSACRAGAANLCSHWAYMGMGCDGCLQDSLVAPRKYVHRLPDTISDEQATVLEPVAVGLHVFDHRLTDRRGDEVATIIGCGPIGLATLQIAKLRGHEVIAVDLVQERLALAARLGADAIVNARDYDAVNRLQVLSGDHPNLVVETAGTTQSAQLAFNAATWRGRIVFVAISPEPIPMRPLISKEVWVTGARGGHLYPEAIELVASGQVQVDPMITHRYGLDELSQAFEVVLARPNEVFRVAIHH